MGYISLKKRVANGGRCKCPSADLEQARARFHLFHCFPANRIIRKPCRRLIPETLVKLGRLRGVIYSSDKGQKGCLQTFIHFMETPPLLACDPEGTQLFILGGRYRVTSRGIEG